MPTSPSEEGQLFVLEGRPKNKAHPILQVPWKVANLSEWVHAQFVAVLTNEIINIKIRVYTLSRG